MHDAEPVEVLVLRYQDKVLRPCSGPDRSISGPTEAKGEGVRGVRVKIGEIPDQTCREILIEQKFHGGLAQTFRQATSGGRDARQPALALGSEREAGTNVLKSELGEIHEDLVLAHPACEIRQDIAHCDASPTHGGLPEANLRVQDDAVAIVH